jgi:hypothetical protein
MCPDKGLLAAAVIEVLNMRQAARCLWGCAVGLAAFLSLLLEAVAGQRLCSYNRLMSA